MEVIGQLHHVNGRPIRRRFAVDGRVRTGCSTCKARKKKCDGQTASNDGRCGSCVRLGLVCEQAPLRTVPRPPRRKPRDAQQITITQPPVREDITADTDCEEAGGSPENYETDSNDAGSPPDEPPPHGEFAHEYAYSAVVSAAPLIPALPGTFDDMERVLLRYFLDRVAPLCSILQQDGHNFCSVLLPMAIVDRSLLQALFTYASVHFEAATPGQLVRSDARLRFENQVARGVVEAITRNAVSESTVASALLTSTAEVISGDTSRWLLHLHGAGHLINYLGASRLLRSADGAFLLRYFAYHDIMASLSTGRCPVGSGVYWVLDADAAVESADSFMGLAHHVFKHLVDICSFVAETADVDASVPLDRRLGYIVRGEDMAQALRLQDLRLRVDSSDTRIKALIHHAEAFRFAGIFYLYRRLLHFCEIGAIYRLRMEDCVRQILQHVAEVPSHMFCEIGLLFPLFMAGIGINGDEAHRDYIEDRLLRIETWTKFRHVERARELLQLLWASERTDWEAMLRELDWNVSLA